MRRIALLLALCLPAAALADGPTPFGYVKGYLFQSLSDPGRIERVGTRLQLGLEGGGGWAGYHLSVDLDLGTRVGGETADTERFGVRPVEAWFEVLGEKLELRVGKQFVFWGRTTWVNPTDVITAWDYGNMSSEIEDYRLAPTAARLRWLITGELELDAVWVPVFVPNRIPGQVGATELRPAQRLGNGEFGLRLAQSVSDWAFDWSVSGYYGFEKLPVVETLGITPDGPILRFHFERMGMVGLDAAKALGPLVLTAEGALKLGGDWAGDDPELGNHRLAYVVGLSWVVSQDLTVGVQNIGELLLGYDQEADRALLLETHSAWAVNPPAAIDEQISVFVQASFAKEWGAQLILIYDATYSDGFALGFLTWNPIDALNLAAGVIAFAGQEDTTPYGRMRDASQLFVEAKYSF